MFTLIYNDATGAAQRVALRDGDFVIGRGTNCDLVVNVASVSRQHARLHVEGGRCLLSDERSTYGTFVKGAPVQGQVDVKPGEVFQCGAVLFTIEAGEPGGGVTLSESHEVLQESASIIRHIDDTGARPAVERTDRTPQEEAVRPPVVVPEPEAHPSERRKGPDRRRAQLPFQGPDRRTGRDRRQARFVRLLSEISKTLVDVLPLQQVLSRVVDLVFEVLPAERTYLMLRDSEDAALTARVSRSRDGSMPEATLSRTVVTKVMRERVAMLADDARYDSRLDEAESVHARLDIRSFMCVPLWNKSEVIGVLYTDNPRTKKFNGEDLDVFMALANYAAVAIEQARVTEQLQREMQKRERLQRYHSPAVVNRIIRATDREAEFEAAERDVTIMFTDIVSFTTRTEHVPPAEVARLLNQFFARMCDVIFEQDGTLDKFIGDAILAVFGAPFAQEDHADRAVRAALGMRRALAEFNGQRGGDDPLRIRIALNSGQALTGDIGSPRRREFTVLGDVVNACSRIESSVCKPDQIVASGSVVERLTEPVTVTPLGSVTLRGRERETEVFLID